MSEGTKKVLEDKFKFITPLQHVNLGAAAPAAAAAAAGGSGPRSPMRASVQQQNSRGGLAQGSPVPVAAASQLHRGAQGDGAPVRLPFPQPHAIKREKRREQSVDRNHREKITGRKAAWERPPSPLPSPHPDRQAAFGWSDARLLLLPLLQSPQRLFGSMAQQQQALSASLPALPSAGGMAQQQRQQDAFTFSQPMEAAAPVQPRE